MTAFVIYEDSEEIIQFPDGLPRASNYPTYTYGYHVESRSWSRVHMGNNAQLFWVELDPSIPDENVPKTIQAAVLLLGG